MKFVSFLPIKQGIVIQALFASATLNLTPVRSTQVGWMTGPARLLAPIIKAHQFLVFTVASSLQRAVAHGLDNEGAFYQ